LKGIDIDVILLFSIHALSLIGSMVVGYIKLRVAIAKIETSIKYIEKNCPKCQPS
jgi:hypothetical protein